MVVDLYLKFSNDLKAVTHYHTMPHVVALQIFNCGKHSAKMRNCL